MHEHALKFMFKASDNEAEYEAMIVGIVMRQAQTLDLRIAK